MTRTIGRALYIQFKQPRVCELDLVVNQYEEQNQEDKIEQDQVVDQGALWK